MAELGSDENKIKRFLANFNTFKAPQKKMKKNMLKKKQYDYHMSGQAV